MKIYIMTDLEGVAGVLNWDDYGAPGARCYELARRLTTLEVNAAIDGFLAAGADDILVVDGHGHGALDLELIHPAARVYAGRPMGYPFMVDETFDAACMIGQHAKSNTDGGHLSHTGSFGVDEMTVNGVSVGELGCNLLFCGWFGVPTVLLSGDLAATEEARALVPNIETAAVKEGVRRGPAHGLTSAQNQVFNCAAVHLAPAAARERIGEAAERALRRKDEIAPYRLEPPYEIRTVLRPTEPGGATRTAVVSDPDLIRALNAPRHYE